MGCGAAVGSPGHHRQCQHQHHDGDGDPDQVDEEDGEGYIVAGSVCVTDEGSGCRVLNALTHSTHRSCKVSLLKTFSLSSQFPSARFSHRFTVLWWPMATLRPIGATALDEFGRFAEESFD